jgi:hypothetical protein
LDTGGPPGTPPVLAFASHRCAELLMPGGYVRPAGGGPAGVEIAFYTADVPAAFSQAVAAGAVVLAEAKVMPWGQTVAYVRSLEGTLIGLCTPMGGASRPDRHDAVPRSAVVPADPAAELRRSLCRPDSDGTNVMLSKTTLDQLQQVGWSLDRSGQIFGANDLGEASLVGESVSEAIEVILGNCPWKGHVQRTKGSSRPAT